MFRREYLSSVVNVLTNSVKIPDQTKEDFFLLNLPQIHEKKMSVVVSSSFQQCLEPVNTLITEWCSEARPFRRLSNHLFWSQLFRK